MAKSLKIKKPWGTLEVHFNERGLVGNTGSVSGLVEAVRHPKAGPTLHVKDSKLKRTILKLAGKPDGGGDLFISINEATFAQLLTMEEKARRLAKERLLEVIGSSEVRVAYDNEHLHIVDDELRGYAVDPAELPEVRRGLKALARRWKEVERVTLHRNRDPWEGRDYEVANIQGRLILEVGRDEDQKADRKTKAILEAKRTGKEVVIERSFEECNDPNLECSLDVIEVVALPSGKIKYRRQHTF